MKAAIIIIIAMIAGTLSGCAGYGGKVSATYGDQDGQTFGAGYEWYRLPTPQKGGGK